MARSLGTCPSCQAMVGLEHQCAYAGHGNVYEYDTLAEHGDPRCSGAGLATGQSLGTCPVCGEPRIVEPDGRMAKHNEMTADVSVDAMRDLLETGRARPLINGTTMCAGSGRLSNERWEWGLRRDKRIRERVVEPRRADAAVVHDAIEAGRDWPRVEVEELRRIALVDYAIRFHIPTPSRPWCAYRRGAARMTAERVVYCVFCRRLLVEGMERTAADWQVEQRTHEHTTRCALRCLAGIDKPVGPDEQPPTQEESNLEATSTTTDHTTREDRPLLRRSRRRNHHEP